MLRGSYPSWHKLVRGPLQSSLSLVPKLKDRRPDMARDGLSVVEWCLKRRRCLSCQGSFAGCCEGSRVATTALGGGLRSGSMSFEAPRSP